ncbi:MAG: hypothetical protein ACI4PF_03820 [Christensenellales bacterium]
MKCPICGEENTLYITELTQNSREYRIKSNGKKCKKPINIQKDLYMDEGFILCCDNGCQTNNYAWEFIDGKLKIYNDTNYLSKKIFNREKI